MNKSQFFIHIGYPKCGSTTLQKQLFSRHPSISYFGIYPNGNIGYDTKNDKELSLALDGKKLEQLHQMILSDDFEKNKLEYNQEVKNLIAQAPSKDIQVLSNERFSLSIFDRTSISDKAKRLAYLFSDAKIIIVVRDPFDWLISQYRDHPFDPSNITNSGFVDFDTWINILFEKRKDVLESLKFEKTYYIYRELFGKENILMLRLDDLNDKVSKLAKFLSLDTNQIESITKNKKENTGVSLEYTYYRRMVRTFKKFIPNNYFTQKIKHSLNNFVKSILPNRKRKIQYSDKIRIRVDNYFSDTNIFIQKL